MNFGEKLTSLRKEKGMSQEDLANELNVSRQAVSKWESNVSYPETDKIVAICKLFNCSMDELIGLKKGKSRKNSKILTTLNEYFETFINGIKMFYVMTFKQKIKCIIEMLFYTLCLYIGCIVIEDILSMIIRNIFSLIPSELLTILINTFRGMYILIFLILSIYILVKLYKVRYLDYYENYLQDKDNDEINKEVKQNEKINIKEEKIIIRDKDNEFKPFNWLKKLIILFCKFIASCTTFGLIIALITLIAITIFITYYIKYGLLIFCIVLGLLGSIVVIYVFIELLIKFIFNMKQNFKRLFIMFIASIFVVGISSGLFLKELTKFKIVNDISYDNKISEEVIEYENNLVLNFLYYINTEVIFEDREDILIEFYGTENNIFDPNLYEEDRQCKLYISGFYNYKDYYFDTDYSDFSLNDLIDLVLNFVKNKEIMVTDSLFRVKPKIHISKENYDKIIANYKKTSECSYYMDEITYD